MYVTASYVAARADGQINFQGSFAAIAGQWYHYAMTRAGSAVSLFIDGAHVAQNNASGVLGTPTSVLHIGGYYPGLAFYLWPGSIADFRVVKGTALYT